MLPKHRREDSLISLKTIDADVPKHLQVHLHLVNHATHKHPDLTKVGA